MDHANRFNVIFRYFEDQSEGSAEKFSQLTEIPESNVRNWLKHECKGSIQVKNRNKILNAFHLDSTIWTDYMNTERYLIENMETYKDRFLDDKLSFISILQMIILFILLLSFSKNTIIMNGI